MSKKDTRISVNKKNGLYLSGVHLFENSHDTPILLCEKKWPFYQRNAKNVPWNVMLFVSCNNSCCIDKPGGGNVMCVCLYKKSVCK